MASLERTIQLFDPPPFTGRLAGKRESEHSESSQLQLSDQAGREDGLPVELAIGAFTIEMEGRTDSLSQAKSKVLLFKLARMNRRLLVYACGVSPHG